MTARYIDMDGKIHLVEAHNSEKVSEYYRQKIENLKPDEQLGQTDMFIVELNNKVWDVKNNKPEDGNDHCIDAFKYGVEVIIDSPSILWLFLSDFVVNAKTLYDAVDFTRLNGFLMGTSYVQYLFVFLPMGGSFFTKLLTGLDMDEVRTGNILTSFSDATYGLGTNMVGDLYMNFSFLGVIILMFLLGMLVARVEIPNSKYQLYAYMALFANCIYLVRADIFSWLTFFVFFLIFDWLLRIHIVYDEDITD